MVNGLAAIKMVNGDYHQGSAACPSIVGSIVDSMSSGVIFMDNTGILTFMNKKAEAILQVYKESVLGKRVDMLPLRTHIYKVMSESCRDYPLEMTIAGRGIMVRSTEVRSPTGAILGEITELMDITAEKKEKRQREESVAMMTHDLKSPLMVMLGYIQAIKLGMWGEVDQQLQSSIDEIEQSGLNLGAMIENVLDVYRLEKGLVRIEKRNCDVGEVLRDCYRGCKLDADEQKVSLRLMTDKELPPQQLDGKQIARVFNNLIGNAIKFTPRGGKVVVTAGIKGDLLLVSVKDTGIGVAEKDIPRIFNKYFRSERTAGFKGSGLGLTICRAIVEAHGGLIEVSSSEGKGSTFTVKLPLNGSQ